MSAGELIQLGGFFVTRVTGSRQSGEAPIPGIVRMIHRAPPVYRNLSEPRANYFEIGSEYRRVDLYDGPIASPSLPSRV